MEVSSGRRVKGRRGRERMRWRKRLTGKKNKYYTYTDVSMGVYMYINVYKYIKTCRNV